MGSTYKGLGVPLYPAESVTIVPAATITGSVLVVGESATPLTPATGLNMIYGYAYHNSTIALTGNLIGVRGNARVFGADATGAAYGGYFAAGNGPSALATLTDGANLATGAGVYGLFAATGAGTSTSCTITNAWGGNFELDIDAGYMTITNAAGVRVNVQTGSRTSSVVTNLYGMIIEHESVSGTARTMDAAIYIKCVNGNEPITVLIDASAADGLGVNGSDQYAILTLPNGTTLYWDVSDSAWVTTA